jgi:HD superfamily phosphodiesterase
MRRVNAILAHPDFRSLLSQIEGAEKTRPFCGHGIEHLLSVARLMTLMCRETGASLPPHLVYGVALVHDLGRATEYAGGTSHEVSGPELALPILLDCGYTAQEAKEICTAIQEHRSSWPGERSPLGAVLYQADKESRPCYACSAAKDCNWPDSKKNLTLTR